MTLEEMKRRQNLELGKYEFISWNDEPMEIEQLLQDYQIIKGKKDNRGVYMKTIEKHLPHHLCKNCDHLTYYDWYMCKLGKHTTKKGFLHMGPLKKCNGFTERKGNNWDSCQNTECVFWCLECPACQNK